VTTISEERTLNKRSIIYVLAGGLMAAMLPGAAVAQNDAEGTLTWANNGNCSAGDEVAWSLPPCELDPDAGILTLTFANPDKMTGTFDGVQVREGVLEFDVDNADFTYTARALFMGTVEGCGPGTVYFKVSGEGGHAAAGVDTFGSHTFTTVPGGTLPVVGSLDMSGTEVRNDDGTDTLSYTGSYSCNAE
jgi:hypothetical protein